jgi:hypothetical protein
MKDATDRTNHALWGGPLLAVAGLVSYFALFARWPVTRDVPWLNLPMVWGGALIALAGAVTAFKRGGWRIGAGALGSLLALGCAALLTFYCFVLSAQMPDAGEGSAEGAQFPTLVLAAHDGTEVDLGEISGGKLMVVVFRGAW